MSDIKTVIIHKINLGSAILRRYQVEYFSGKSRIYGTPPNTVTKFIRENRIDYQKVKYNFKSEE